MIYDTKFLLINDGNLPYYAALVVLAYLLGPARLIVRLKKQGISTTVVHVAALYAIHVQIIDFLYLTLV